MPFNPKDVGNNLIKAGESQIAAGNRCIKYAETAVEASAMFKNDSRVFKDMDSIEAGTRSVGSLLTPVSNKIKAIAEAFGNFSVPAISTTSRSIDIPGIGSIKFITGMTIRSTNPLTSVATSLNNIAGNIDRIVAALATIAEGLNDVQTQFPEIRKNLLEGSTEVKTGGENMILAGTAMKDAGKLLLV